MMYGKFLIPLAFNQSQFRQLSGKFPDYGRSVSIMRRFAVIERPVFSADVPLFIILISWGVVKTKKLKIQPPFAG